MNQISTIQQLQAQVSTTYIMAIICAGVCILLSIGIASMIPYSPGARDRSFVKRRIWYIILGFVAAVAFFLTNYFVIVDRIKSPALEAKYINGLSISTGLLTGLYIVLGILIMVIFKKSKYGSILNRKSKN
jgi:preprotein translocase subunit SecG